MKRTTAPRGLDARSVHLRREILHAVEHARRGHVNSAFSVVEILRVLYDEVLRHDPANPLWPDRDRFVLSKGHGCLALSAILAGARVGVDLATPIGPAAGPHTQLAQNIVAAWLSGGRFIELKTVQIMDELEIPRPCIDLEDEGYNVEWSQELKLDQSAGEYVKAWVLIHLLHRVLGCS